MGGVYKDLNQAIQIIIDIDKTYKDKDEVYQALNQLALDEITDLILNNTRDAIKAFAKVNNSCHLGYRVALELTSRKDFLESLLTTPEDVITLIDELNTTFDENQCLITSILDNHSIRKLISNDVTAFLRSLKSEAGEVKYDMVLDIMAQLDYEGLPAKNTTFCTGLRI